MNRANRIVANAIISLNSDGVFGWRGPKGIRHVMDVMMRIEPAFLKLKSKGNGWFEYGNGSVSPSSNSRLMSIFVPCAGISDYKEGYERLDELKSVLRGLTRVIDGKPENGGVRIVLDEMWD